MLGGELEVPGVAEESSKTRGEQPNHLPLSAMIAILGGLEQRLEAARIAYSKPAAPSVKEFAMTLKQVDAREPQRQSSRSIKLFVGYHRCRDGARAPPRSKIILLLTDPDLQIRESERV